MPQQIIAANVPFNVPEVAATTSGTWCEIRYQSSALCGTLLGGENFSDFHQHHANLFTPFELSLEIYPVIPEIIANSSLFLTLRRNACCEESWPTFSEKRKLGILHLLRVSCDKKARQKQEKSFCFCKIVIFSEIWNSNVPRRIKDWNGKALRHTHRLTHDVPKMLTFLLLPLRFWE